MENLFSVPMLVVWCYLAGVLLVGFWLSGRNKTADEYSLGGKNIPGWAMGLSVLGTFTSSITFMGVPEKAYSQNWNIFWFGAALPVAAWFAARYFIPLYRKHVRYSAYEFLEQRFGLWARLYGAFSYIVLQLVRTATVLLLVSFAAAPLLDLPVLPTIIILGFVVIVYDTVGGLLAVIWTDAVQVIILSIGACWCLWILIANAGGVSEFFASLPAAKTTFGAWDAATQSGRPWFEWFDLTRGTLFVVFLYGLSENVRNYGTDENYVQRYLSTATEQSAARSVWLGALSYIPLSIVFILIGSGLVMEYPTPPIVDGLPLRSDQVFPYFIRHALPVPITGLVVAAIMGAAMSTIDSSLNATATVILTDFARRFFGNFAARQEIFVLRCSTVAVGCTGTLAAALLFTVYQKEARGITDIWWQYAGTAGGGLLGLFLVAWLIPNTRSWVAALGTASTVPVLFWGTFLRQPATDRWYANFACPLHPNLIGISATVTMLCVVVALNCLAGTRPNKPEEDFSP